jgi:hypothetical protein
MFVKPAPGVLLRDPVTKRLLSAAPMEGVAKPVTVLPQEGMEVSDFDRFWLRRIRDRDAVKVEPKSSAKQANTATVAEALQAPAVSVEQGAK